jgi:hypothetical protein
VHHDAGGPPCSLNVPPRKAHLDALAGYGLGLGSATSSRGSVMMPAPAIAAQPGPSGAIAFTLVATASARAIARSRTCAGERRTRAEACPPRRSGTDVAPTAPTGYPEPRQQFSLTHRWCRAHHIQPHHSPSRKAPKKITSALITAVASVSVRYVCSAACPPLRHTRLIRASSYGPSRLIPARRNNGSVNRHRLRTSLNFSNAAGASGLRI